MAVFRYIVEQGNHGFHHEGQSKTLEDGKILCTDGFEMVVKAGQDIPCNPTVTNCDETCDHPWKSDWHEKECTYAGPYESFLVEKVSEVPPNFNAWCYYGSPHRPKGPFFHVPKDMVKELIENHGGEIG